MAALVPNHILKRPKRNFFVDQNDCLVKIIKGEKRDENLRCGAAMVTKIVREKKTVENRRKKTVENCLKKREKQQIVKPARILKTCD